MRLWFAAFFGIAVLFPSAPAARATQTPTCPTNLPAMISNHPNYGVIAPIPFLIKAPAAWPEGDLVCFLRNLGVRTIRIDLFWSEIQPVENPSPPAPKYNFDPRIKPSLEQVVDAGIDVFVSLSSAPAWAAPTNANGDPLYGHMPVSTKLNAWKDFVKFVLDELNTTKLRSHVTFGIWNEPDLNEFKPEDYDKLFRLAHDARLSMNPLPNPLPRFGAPETSEGAVTKFLPDTLKLLETTPAAFQQSDVITVHWYPGNVSRDLPVYMERVLRSAGTRETWLTETGEQKDEEDEQQATIGNIMDVFNRRPSTRWSKIFVYRLFAGDQQFYNLLKAPGEYWVRKEAFFTYRRKIRTFVVNLKADNNNFVSVTDNSQYTLSANVVGTTPNVTQTFVLEDLDGGEFVPGDLVTIHATGGNYLHMAGGDGSTMTASAPCACTETEQFVAEGSWTAADAKPGGTFEIVLKSLLPIKLPSMTLPRYVSRNTVSSIVTKGIATPGATEKLQLTVR